AEKANRNDRDLRWSHVVALGVSTDW
nr:hypothetical protein [Tanacetum cinerariifolium]